MSSAPSQQFMISSRLTKLVDRTLLAGAAVCLAAFLYLFFHYTLTGQREFDGLAPMLLYYGVPLTAAVLLLSSLRLLRPDHRLNVALAIASLAVALYVGEHLLAYLVTKRAEATETFSPGDHTEARFERIARMAAEEGVTFDTRFVFEVVMDLRAKGVPAVPFVFPRVFLLGQPDESVVSTITIDGSEVVPLGGVANAVTVFCNETGEYLVYTSDERGFHNPEGMWHADPLEVVAIGDSFAQGMCVPSDQNFVALIRDHHPGTLNLGISDTGPLIQLAVLEEYVRPLEPRLVLWFYFEGNDMFDLNRESRNALLMRYLEGDFRQELVDRQEAVDAALLELIDEAIAEELARREEAADTGWAPRELFRSLTVPINLRHIRRSLGLLDPVRSPGVIPSEELPMDLFRDILSRAATSVSSWGGSLRFVFLPSRDRYASQQYFPRAKVFDAVREAGIPIIDIHDAFVAHGDPVGLFPFRRFGHYSEEGHRLVAETVMREMDLRFAGSPESRALSTGPKDPPRP